MWMQSLKIGDYIDRALWDLCPEFLGLERPDVTLHLLCLPASSVVSQEYA